jgi:hypothetical protein
MDDDHPLAAGNQRGDVLAHGGVIEALRAADLDDEGGVVPPSLRRGYLSLRFHS